MALLSKKDGTPRTPDSWAPRWLRSVRSFRGSAWPARWAGGPPCACGCRAVSLLTVSPLSAPGFRPATL
eukprot:7079098-Pyramimonas_sp.AAC.1